MADHKRYSAGCKPFDALGDQQHVAEPAEEQGEDDGRGRRAGRRNIEAEQAQQDKGLGDVPEPGVFLQGSVQMDGG